MTKTETYVPGTGIDMEFDSDTTVGLQTSVLAWAWKVIKSLKIHNFDFTVNWKVDLQRLKKFTSTNLQL